jgi:hypothetical protein
MTTTSFNKLDSKVQVDNLGNPHVKSLQLIVFLHFRRKLLDSHTVVQFDIISVQSSISPLSSEISQIIGQFESLDENRNPNRDICIN